MGSFGGHALPGSFFIVFSLWWSVQLMRRYFESLTVGGKRYYSTPTFPCPCPCGRRRGTGTGARSGSRGLEVEGLLIVIVVLIAGAIEIYTAFKDGHFTYLGNAQHATMYFFFGMYGVVCVLMHHGVPLPRNLDYISMALGLIVEGLLFSYHVHLHERLEMVLHQLLVYTIIVSVGATLLEMKYRRSVLPALMRTYCTLLQGTWFWQIAFILYNPMPNAAKWESEKMENILLASTFFAWHMAGALLLLMLICAVTGAIYRCRGAEFKTSSGESQYDSLSMKLITRDANGHTIVNMNDDSESDIEYEKPVTRGAHGNN